MVKFREFSLVSLTSVLITSDDLLIHVQNAHCYATIRGFKNTAFLHDPTSRPGFTTGIILYL
jgi:hypothetical protein